MIQSFKRAWSEIKRGENVDLYVTVTVAVLLVFLTIVPVPGDWVNRLPTPLMIAVLALLAISMVGTRHRLDDIASRTTISQGITFLNEFPNSLPSDIAGADELWFVGMSLVRTTRNQLKDIEQVLSGGGSVHILVINPDGIAHEIADARSYLSRSAQSLRNDILSTLDIYCSLQASYPDRVDIRTIEYALDHLLIAVDVHRSTGIIYVSNYSFRTPSASKPKFVLTAQHATWYDFYRNELQLLFAASQPWRYPQLEEAESPQIQ